jgi:hypothetical protein
VGALPEIIRDGVDGFFGDDAAQLAYLIDRVEGLDRRAIRTSVIERFSAGRMTDGYEAIYRRLLGEAGREPSADDGPQGFGAPHALKPHDGELRAAGRAS